MCYSLFSAPTNDEAFGFMFYVKLQNSPTRQQNSGNSFASDGISISVIDENMNFYASGKSSLSHLGRGTFNQISVEKQTVDRTNEWKFYQTRQCTPIEEECNWMQCQMTVIRTGKLIGGLKAEIRVSLGIFVSVPPKNCGKFTFFHLRRVLKSKIPTEFPKTPVSDFPEIPVFGETFHPGKLQEIRFCLIFLKKNLSAGKLKTLLLNFYIDA